jgi:Calcineurin-like phosphoesterase
MTTFRPTLAFLSFALSAGLAIISSPAHTRSNLDITYVVLGPNGDAIARLITSDTQCPGITIDALTQPMDVRAPSSNPAFPVLVCEALIPSGAISAEVLEQRLPLPRSDPEHIVSLGDTGCRLKQGDPVQACNDPQQWPFARVGESAAATRPDVVIHVGDYLYREMPCPTGDTGCAGSPFADNWEAWRADFFEPATPLLKAAPWIAVRGDHELCNRGGGGYFRFLDPRAWPGECRDDTEPYTIPMGELTIIVMDVSGAVDEAPPLETIQVYKKQFHAIQDMVSTSSWLVMHKPLWAFRPVQAKDGTQTLTILNPTLQAASNNMLPHDVTRVLSGHIHLFEALSFADDRRPQFVLGTGGTLQDPESKSPLVGQVIGNTTVTQGATVARFGFTTFNVPTGVVTLHDLEGRQLMICKPRGSDIHCTQ